MIANHHPIVATYKRLLPDGRAEWTSRPVIAWTDAGEPLVMGQYGLVAAAAYPDFDGIGDDMHDRFAGFVPGQGWAARITDRDGSTFDVPVIAFGLDDRGFGRPITATSDGNIDVERAGDGVEFVPPGGWRERAEPGRETAGLPVGVAIRPPGEDFSNHFTEAEHWLAEADQRTNVEAGRECLAAAAIHAVLALAAVTASAAGNRATGGADGGPR